MKKENQDGGRRDANATWTKKTVTQGTSKTLKSRKNKENSLGPIEKSKKNPKASGAARQTLKSHAEGQRMSTLRAQ